MVDDRNAVITLAGNWHAALDREDRGLAERWPNSALKDGTTCRLPGSIQEQGLGDDISPKTQWVADLNQADSWYTSPRFEAYRQPGHIKIPYFLQPLKHYVGVVWFEREFEVSAAWAGQRTALTLERAHWQTRCWVDGKECGAADDSLATPHERVLPPLTAGRHRMTLRVDNRMIHEVGPNSHSMSDHTQGAWNGVVGRIELRLLSRVRIRDVAVFAEPGDLSVRVTGMVEGADENVSVDFAIDGRQSLSKTIDLRLGSRQFDVSLQLTEPLTTWDEFQPNLHMLSLTTQGGSDRDSDRVDVTFGVRRFATRGTQFEVNGRLTFLRGTLDCCIFPMTGYPPTDLTSWQHVMRTAKTYGLNHIRFHSYCPPEAAFAAADEAGIYLQVECGSWANQGATVGDGKSLDQWLYDEAQRIVDAYGNHPSFVMLAYGNEPAGDHHVAYLTRWVEHWKAKDPRRLHTTGAGWTTIPESDFHSIWDPRIQHWGAGLSSRINSKEPETTTDYRDAVRKHAGPIVTHEIGQWCVYPNIEEISKYKGAYRATSIEMVKESLESRGLTHLARAFVEASGKLQALCYKEEIESQLRTPGLGGFQLLGLQDFPGQGTALVGVVDAFWDSKAYISSAEFRRFCNPTVVLARLPRRVLTNEDAVEAELLIAHFGEKPGAPAHVDWTLEDVTHRTKVATGICGPTAMPQGSLTSFGQLRIELSGTLAPAQLRLVAQLRGTEITNDWDLWVYPTETQERSEPLVCDAIDDTFLRAAETGRPILLSFGGRLEKPEVELGFSSIFWNTLFTRGQPPHTLGILCDPSHPLLASFPTESHSNWQWSEPIRHARCLLLHRIRRLAIDPIVRVIDDWNENRSLGLLVEVRVGESRVIVSGIDLTGDLSDRHVSRQLRMSVLKYLSATRHDETTPLLTFDELHTLVASETRA